MEKSESEKKLFLRMAFSLKIAFLSSCVYGFFWVNVVGIKDPSGLVMLLAFFYGPVAIVADRRLAKSAYFSINSQNR